jgi:hypothetical protein
VLLRGEIRPEVLDPFGSQHRTMTYNLLPSGEEDDPRPLDREFGRRGADGGGASYFACGLGASARRGSGAVTLDRWMFVTRRRPGRDLLLRQPTGCLAQKDLRRQHGVHVMIQVHGGRGGRLIRRGVEMRIEFGLPLLDLRGSRSHLLGRVLDLIAQLAEIREAEETSPPEPSLWARRRRPSPDMGMGAPLWRCVQPRSGLSQVELDSMEAALAASSMLDAWITPDGDVGGRIEQAREDAAAEGAADWRQHLAAALDYRRWLRVRVLFRSGSLAEWRPFDARRHGEKSGGEKVVLLAQPLFAAAVVAYDSASRLAPRMVWLDEAMTGVDDDAKASFMGLTAELDLDVMLTAHDEWCTYETVPAIAIYDLARIRYAAGVDLLPFLWCGGELTEVAVASGDVCGAKGRTACSRWNRPDAGDPGRAPGMDGAEGPGDAAGRDPIPGGARQLHGEWRCPLRAVG